MSQNHEKGMPGIDDVAVSSNRFRSRIAAA